MTGHGIEPSITAFQAKYLLRVFLRQYRDPAQALEELNAPDVGPRAGPRSSSRCCVVVFDTEAGTLRYASAGHPPAWLWHDREVRPLRATGPLLHARPRRRRTSAARSRSTRGDLLLLYTDGLAEARDGEQLFGEERIASILRRDPGVDARRAVQDAARGGPRLRRGAAHRRRRHPRHPPRRDASTADHGRDDRRRPPSGPCAGNLDKGGEKLAAPGQAVRPRPARPAARRRLVRRGRACWPTPRPTTCPADGVVTGVGRDRRPARCA